MYIHHLDINSLTLDNVNCGFELCNKNLRFYLINESNNLSKDFSLPITVPLEAEISWFIENILYFEKINKDTVNIRDSDFETLYVYYSSKESNIVLFKKNYMLKLTFKSDTFHNKIFHFCKKFVKSYEKH